MFKTLLAIYFSTCISCGITKFSQSQPPNNSLFTSALVGVFPIENQEIKPLKTQEKININILPTPQEMLIKNQVNRTFRRVKPIFHTWLIILLMLSAAPVGMIWLILAKLAKETEVYSQKLDQFKHETISEIHALTTDAKNTIAKIQEKRKVAQPEPVIFDSQDLYLSDEMMEIQLNIVVPAVMKHGRDTAMPCP
jgi:hypothetical protein